MKVYRFSRFAKYFYLLSFLLILIGSVVVYSYTKIKFGIDFEGGARFQYEIPAVTNAAAVKEVLQKYSSVVVQKVKSASTNGFLIRVVYDNTKDFLPRVEKGIHQLLVERFGDQIVLQETAFVGATLSRTLAFRTIILIVGTLVLILIYLWFRFHISFAVASIVALIHDVLFILLFVGIVGIEISSATIAAFLTVIGYSLNDTIVVFDRIRENRMLMQNHELHVIVDTSITQSLSRTIITSLTTMMASAAIVLFAHGEIRNFAIALTFGVFIGTYSSIFIASPVYMFLQKKNIRTKKSNAPAATSGEEKGKTPDTAASSMGAVDIEAIKRDIGWKKKSTKKKKR